MCIRDRATVGQVASKLVNLPQHAEALYEIARYPHNTPRRQAHAAVFFWCSLCREWYWFVPGCFRAVCAGNATMWALILSCALSVDGAVRLPEAQSAGAARKGADGIRGRQGEREGGDETEIVAEEKEERERVTGVVEECVVACLC
eukprot:2934842-Rhodomonas_salina.1